MRYRGSAGAGPVSWWAARGHTRRPTDRWTSVGPVRSWEADSGCLLPSQVIALPVGGTPPVHHDGGAHCCPGASARSAEDGWPKPWRRVPRKGEDVIVATLSATTAHLLSVLIRPLVLVARMRVHVRMDPESAYHGLLGHGGRYVLGPPASRVEGLSPTAQWDPRRRSPDCRRRCAGRLGHTGRRAASTTSARGPPEGGFIDSPCLRASPPPGR
jgi:hypothetical protein